MVSEDVSSVELIQSVDASNALRTMLESCGSLRELDSASS